MRLTDAHGRTITVSPKVEAVIRLVIEQQDEIEAVPFGSWQVHFSGKKVSSTLSKSFRPVTLDDPQR